MRVMGIGKRSINAVVWCPSTIGQLKINSDAAVDVVSPVVVEVVALLRGLRFAKDTGLGPMVVETNAVVAVSRLNNSNPTCADVSLVINDIKDFMRFVVCLFGFSCS
ncbi:hypothetical protein EZV62_014953 [Acer yangbiense]|uniref:RNase H type-1 domain-containing protein n=1 Tax=Acer yangbiense TaxID=1000413 RepID=A0A5C7HTY1_9ROSI|nr:hypothetical protein EZV62_014953 [Acer yangbiense]